MKEETAINPNAGVIAGLREAADYLEARPGMPPVSMAWISIRVETADELRQAARVLRSFTKQADDYAYRLKSANAKLGPVEIEVSIPRDTICKKRIVWDCPQDLESLLKGTQEVL